MAWIWLLPAAVTLAALVVMSLALRGVGREAKALEDALSSWNAMAVATSDLDHEARRVQRRFRRFSDR